MTIEQNNILPTRGQRSNLLKYIESYPNTIAYEGFCLVLLECILLCLDKEDAAPRPKVMELFEKRYFELRKEYSIGPEQYNDTQLYMFVRLKPYNTMYHNKILSLVKIESITCFKLVDEINNSIKNECIR